MISLSWLQDSEDTEDCGPEGSGGEEWWIGKLMICVMKELTKVNSNELDCILIFCMPARRMHLWLVCGWRCLSPAVSLCVHLRGDAQVIF